MQTSMQEPSAVDVERAKAKLGVKSTVTHLAGKMSGGRGRGTEEPAAVADSKAQAAEEAGIIDGLAEKSASINDNATLAVKYNQALVRGQTKFRTSINADEKVEISEKALADAVRAIEKADAASYSLKAQAKDVLSRLHHTFGYDRTRVRQLIKERRLPKGQLELDLKTERTELDKLHAVCEKRGAPRVEDQKVTKRKAA